MDARRIIILVMLLLPQLLAHDNQSSPFHEAAPRLVNVRPNRIRAMAVAVNKIRGERWRNFNPV